MEAFATPAPEAANQGDGQSKKRSSKELPSVGAKNRKVMEEAIHVTLSSPSSVSFYIQLPPRYTPA